MSLDPIQVALAACRILEQLGIPHVVGGSLASTLHGEPRTTVDVGIAAQLTADKIDALVAALEPDFFVQPHSVRAAVDGLTSFNAIHRASMLRVDLYVRRAEGLHASEVVRAHLVPVAGETPGTIRVASPEDTLLQKLRWYRMGGDQSERPWRDVLGIVKALGDRLDRPSLDRWAASLGISDLLERALK